MPAKGFAVIHPEIVSPRLERCLEEAKGSGIKRVFALTYQQAFFEKFGFKQIDKSKLPQKIWGDCLRCPKFPECDEQAVILHLGVRDRT